MEVSLGCKQETRQKPSAALHPGPTPMPAANEKNAMFAGLCWKLAASKSDTARNTGMNLSMTVRPMVANSAARPTSQFARAPDATTCNHPVTPPISRYAILPSIISARRAPDIGWVVSDGRYKVTDGERTYEVTRPRHDPEADCLRRGSRPSSEARPLA